MTILKKGPRKPIDHLSDRKEGLDSYSPFDYPECTLIKLNDFKNQKIGIIEIYINDNTKYKLLQYKVNCLLQFIQ